MTHGTRSTNLHGGTLRRFGHGLKAVVWIVFFVSTSGTWAAEDSSEQQRLVEEATLTFERFLEQPGVGAWYLTEARNAKAVLIVPRLLEGAFVVGAAGGSGVLLARDFVKGGWSPPAFYTLSIASLGLQAGAQSSEVVLIVQTFSGLERFYGMGTAGLGLDAGITVGPFGQGGTSGLDIVSFSWSKGLYGGMSLAGMAVTAAGGDNEAYYGAHVKPEDILSNGAVTNSAADRLRETVGRMMREAEMGVP
jgi:lipid-binding SYLF domain-containing protein